MQRVAHDNGRVVDEIGPAKPATVAQCHEVIDALTQQVDLLRQQVVQQDEKLAPVKEVEDVMDEVVDLHDGVGNGNGIIYASLDSTAGYRNPHIALFNAADLSYTGTVYPITGAPANPNNDVASWFAVDTARGLGYGKEWQNGNTINVYNLADWSFSHTITLNTSTHNIQGAKVRGDWLYMSSDNATQSIYRANLVNGRVEELFQLPSPTGEREVEGIALRDNGAGGFDLYAELIVDPDRLGFVESNTNLRVDLYRYTLATAVPEPQTWALMLIGPGLLGRRAAGRR